MQKGGKKTEKFAKSAKKLRKKKNGKDEEDTLLEFNFRI